MTNTYGTELLVNQHQAGLRADADNHRLGRIARRSRRAGRFGRRP